MQRLVSGETMLAAAAEPVPATSQLDLAPPPSPAKKPWALVGIAGVALAGVLAFVLTRGGSDEVSPAKQPEPEITQPPIAKEPEPPPPKAPEVITPPVETGSAGGATATAIKEPDPVKKPQTTKREKRDKRDKRPAKIADPKPPPTTPPSLPFKDTNSKDSDTGSGSGKKTAPLPF